MRWLIITFFVSTLILSSCSSKSLIKSEKERLNSLKVQCETKGMIFFYNANTKEASCVEVTPDAGKRCTKSIDCEGFCEGSNASTSSGMCSKEWKLPSGCVLIIERGERFKRCNR